ncbi:DUF3389 family protein [Vibrio sp. 10N]|uniref:DUF3389 family protein n=1 Tax=Vibrio sp. 10N TaxID=3058938 RepID=UPI0028148EBB|nr:DUF3389 domain-containing protein [Vibrio sp. 10N]
MVINFSSGKVIATPHEVVVRYSVGQITLQSQVDALQLILPACILSANGAECKWSVKLDDETQVNAISEACGIEILRM